MSDPKQTKPFDSTKPVQTRDGRKARILATDLTCVDGYSIAAAITDRNGNECIYSYAPSGALRIDSQSQHDLINIPQKREGWIAVNFVDVAGRSGLVGTSTNVYCTAEAAARYGNVNSQIIRIVEEP